ncbi:beta-ketoacyl synthase N-terminal-like domain-containing protein [Serratia quinivorans]|uniref:beta-ketoacyl synthase N-terminal-like domain-containing protein n=1 Tax=Serratia quinivorans TaxID=137545 RepID=UPI0034C642A4
MDDLIAVVGMACSLPGASNYHEYWHNLCAGKVAYSSQSLADHGDEMITAKGKMADPEGFEPQKYNITEKEALVMDPQLRKYIELVDSALQDAGYPQGKGLGKTGVIASQGTNQTYHNELTRLIAMGKVAQPSQLLESINKGADFLATRAAYIFDFTGPCFNLQSACSSSLTSIVEAVYMLRSQRCEVVVTGAVNISYPLEAGYRYENGSIYSKSGVCRPFDRAADGTLPSNGGGVVVLKRLADAKRDGDKIHALIAGALSNNDGAQKMSYAAPSINGQYQLLRELYQCSGINPRTLKFVECHATGTLIGDPMEVKSLRQLMQDYPVVDNQTTLLGSAKGNIGHLFWASGIASFIKSVLSVKHGIYPGTANFECVNPLLTEAADDGMRFSGEAIELGEDASICAGVSSMGVGGTNAHVIVKRHPGSFPSAGRNVELSQRSAGSAFSLIMTDSAHSQELVQAVDGSGQTRWVSDSLLPAVVALFGQALGEGSLDEDSNYFDYYGDSITAVELIASIKKLCGHTVTSEIIYEHPTPGKLSAYLLSVLGADGAEQIEKHPVSEGATDFNRYQSRFYLLEKLQRGDFSHYNVPLCFEIPSQFPRQAFSAALQRILTALPQCAKGLTWKGQALMLTEKRRVCLFEEERFIKEEEEPDSVFNLLFGRRFALENGEVCALSYVTYEERNYLVLNMPHLLIDGSGMHNLLLALNETTETAVLAPRYLPSRNNKPLEDHSREYWKGALAGTRATRLPGDIDNGETHVTLRAAAARFALDAEDVKRIHLSCGRRQVSPFVIFYAIFNLYLSRISSSTAVCTGTTIANRVAAETYNIGCFINNIVISIDCSTGNIAEIINLTRDKLNTGLRHGGVPLEAVAADLQAKGRPLYDILFMYQNQNRGYVLNFANWSLPESAVRYQPVYTPLCFNIVPGAHGMDVDITYNSSLYSGDYIMELYRGFAKTMKDCLDELESE